VRKAWIWLSALLLICMLPLMAGAEELRGYVKGIGYQYVLMGSYPYEADGTEKPVMWRILEVKDDQALLLTQQVIDAQQVIFESDPEKKEKHDYRRIASYEESDLYTWLNTEMYTRLMEDEPLADALIAQGEGKLFILDSMQFLNTDYGFAKTRWNEQKSRQAAGTPYAKSRGLYTGNGISQTPYWVSTLKDPAGYRMQIVGYNGHMSWGGYTRTDVGVRPSVRLDLTKVQVVSGAGKKDDPFVLAYIGGAQETPVPAETPVPTPEPTAVPTAVPASAGEGEVLVSFVGDCSIGDASQYVNAEASYHRVIDANGYAWPFSLVRAHLAQDDLTVANLELVFTEEERHTDKKFNLVADPDHVQVLLEGSIEMVNTVNNHCMDFYQDGYEDSIATLDAAGVDRFGTVYPGRENGYDDLAIRDVGGIRFGFVGFTYPQESDQKRIAQRITKLKEEQGCDVVIVSLHWGRETHATPTVGQVDYAKRVIKAGADVIWGHHPHVLQPIHFYQGKPIMYSTGNFTFGTIGNLDPATGIFQLAYERVDGQVQLKRMQVIPCMTQKGGDYRPYELTDEKERLAVFSKLIMKKAYKGLDNPPESFLENGVICFENGEMQP